MITFLNDRDWQVRAAFFHHICEMGAYAGSEGLQAFLLPCLEQVHPSSQAKYNNLNPKYSNLNPYFLMYLYVFYFYYIDSTYYVLYSKMERETYTLNA